MELGGAGLREQPFRIHGRPLVYVSYKAQRAAHEFLEKIYSHPSGIGLFQGSPLSGKSTILWSFAESLEDDADFAVVDGSGLNTTAIIESVLSQFGFQVELTSVNELISMLKVYVLQRTATAHAPLLIIENTHELNPSALRVLCELATLRVRRDSALRLVLAGDHSMETIVSAPAMDCVAARLVGEFNLGPMTRYETPDYLYEKLRAGGCLEPHNVIPDEVCDELHTASGGWPGILDRLVLLALAKAPKCPLSKDIIEHPTLPNELTSVTTPHQSTEDSAEDADSDIPKLIVTKNGNTIREVRFEKTRLIFGRSDHNDLRIDSKFISRHHAMLIRNGESTFLMDLNSTNGTFVNSKRISNQVLMHDDVITLGNHGIKFIHPAAKGSSDPFGGGIADTILMKSVQDMRRMLARENTQSIPVPDLQGVADDN